MGFILQIVGLVLMFLRGCNVTFPPRKDGVALLEIGWIGLAIFLSASVLPPALR